MTAERTIASKLGYSGPHHDHEDLSLQREDRIGVPIVAWTQLSKGIRTRTAGRDEDQGAVLVNSVRAAPGSRSSTRPASTPLPRPRQGPR